MRQMATLNKAACEAVRDLRVHGATDITGFGMMGHGCEMAEGAGLTLTLDSRALPVFPGALELVRDGVFSGGCNRGKAWLANRAKVEATVDEALGNLVFDAETSGGLVVAIAPDDADKAIRRLRDVGAPCAVAIGRFGKRAVGEPFIWLR